MKILALARGPLPRTYYITQSPPRCGQIRVKLVELPTDAEPPFVADMLKNKRGTILLGIRRIDLSEYILQNHENAIEGEVRNGVLRGVVCNKRVNLMVSTNVEGPVLAIVPVVRFREELPRSIFILYTYEIPVR